MLCRKVFSPRYLLGEIAEMAASQARLGAGQNSPTHLLWATPPPRPPGGTPLERNPPVLSSGSTLFAGLWVTSPVRGSEPTDFKRLSEDQGS